MASIYRTPEGRARILELYDRGVEALGLDVEERWVGTRFGRTHVLVVGPEGAPPLVAFHGGNATNPLSLAWFRPLAETWRIHAPDTVGHPGKSAETRPDPGGDDYGLWAVDVLEGLGLGRVPMVGPSYGAGIVLRTAAVEPERVERAALVVPAGVVSLRRVAVLARVALPALAWRLHSSRGRLEAVERALFTEPPTGLWRETLEATLEHVEVERRMPKAATREDLAGYAGPTLVIGASDDPLFPGAALAARAPAAIPGRVDVVVLDGERHVPSPGALGKVAARVAAFLAEGEAGGAPRGS